MLTRYPGRCTQTVTFAGDSAGGGGGVGATRIVSHLLASKRKSERAKLHHLFRATNGEIAGQSPETRSLTKRQQRGHGTVSWRKPRWRRGAMN